MRGKAWVSAAERPLHALLALNSCCDGLIHDKYDAGPTTGDMGN